MILRGVAQVLMFYMECITISCLEHNRTNITLYLHLYLHISKDLIFMHVITVNVEVLFWNMGM